MAITHILPEILDQIYIKRPDNSHKYDFGYLLILGGSEYYTGAPVLAALAAFAAGIDMARIIAPESASNIIASFSPLIAATSFKGTRLTSNNLGAILTAIESVQAFSQGKCALVIGSGLGRSPDTLVAVRKLINNLKNLPTIIDADAIRAFSSEIESLKGKNLIFTPHAQEFSILTDNNCNELDEEKTAELVRNQSANLGAGIILKGPTDFISDGNQVAVSSTGNPLMTKGGTGDTLAGLLGALLARGINMFDAACAAAYINGAPAI